MSQVVTHTCPNCDGPLLFDPKTQKFHCEYCLSTFTEAEIASYEQQPQTEEPAAKASTQTEENMEMFSCSSCGAQIVTDVTTAATFCYFCHNPVILSGRVSGEFLPEKVLPFKIEKEEAVKKFLAWTEKKRFIPKSFFNQQQIEKLTGVYFPYWVVDASKKIYYYAMNGQTGQTSGVLPIDYKRLGITSLGIFLIALIIGLIGGWFI